MKDIKDLRNQIDAIDDEILKKLNERMLYVKQIGDLKQLGGSSIYRPEREEEILRRLNFKNDGILNFESIKSIYLEIFSVSRNIESPQKIAYLGPEASYTHQAAKSVFGGVSKYLALSSIEAIFMKLSQKEIKYGVVPIENNTEGAVTASFDCLGKFKDVKIVAELYLDIHHSFASHCENLSDINKIYSHTQGYNQCRKFLEDHMLLDIEFIAAKSTSQAAFLASKDKHSAAICSKIAAKMQNLPILFHTIEDNMANRTRFFVLSDFKNTQSQNCKTSILAKTDHTSGALASLLNIFKSEDINLNKLESRPIKQKDFKSIFYIDFDGHIDDANVVRAINRARDFAIAITWLGSYPNGM